MPESAAHRSGLQAGDRILSIDGQSVSRFEDIAPIVSIHPGETVDITLNRNGEEINLPVKLQSILERDRFGNEFRKGQLGILATGRVIVPLAPTEIVGAAIRHTRDIVSMMVETIGQVLTGRRSVQELGGPLKIAQFSGQQATLGAARPALLTTQRASTGSAPRTCSSIPASETAACSSLLPSASIAPFACASPR